VRRLPSLPALRAFEAAGRHLSFRRAAEELLVTPSAISHQVQRLERELGTALFRRKTRAIALTPAGERYLDGVRRAFDLLAEETRAVRAPERAVLRVSLLASFATHWLVPRLGRFAAAHPDVELRLEPSNALVDLKGGEGDLAIRYGTGGWPEVEATLLMPDRIAPVVSPALLERGPPIAAPADLLHHTLLLSYAREPIEWPAWSAAHGFDLARARTLMLHDYNIVLEAALAGQGVAMGRHALIGERLRAGALVEPLGGPPFAPPGLGYWLVTRPGPLPPPVAAFIDWIRGEAAASGRDPTPWKD
jgi:LysR family glycine cleavage system transcriptional activator